MHLPGEVGEDGNLERLVQIDAKLGLGLVLRPVHDEPVLLKGRASVRVLGGVRGADDEPALVPGQRPLIKTSALSLRSVGEQERLEASYIRSLVKEKALHGGSDEASVCEFSSPECSRCLSCE